MVMKKRKRQVLSWFALISEIKKVKKGDYIGYDLTERVNKDTKIAIVPIGYWHGLPRSLSSIGEVWIKNKPARIMGRVSMDLIVVDISNINCKIGDKIEIKPMEIAQKTNSYQLNKNLLLGKDARIDTKPQLEIGANDVKCTHGATIGQLNEDEIFYLQSRSIPRKTAVKMLCQGFVDDIINTIPNGTVRYKLNRLLEPTLASF